VLHRLTAVKIKEEIFLVTKLY